MRILITPTSKHDPRPAPNTFKVEVVDGVYSLAFHNVFPKEQAALIGESLQSFFLSMDHKPECELVFKGPAPPDETWFVQE